MVILVITIDPVMLLSFSKCDLFYNFESPFDDDLSVSYWGSLDKIIPSNMAAAFMNYSFSLWNILVYGT